MSLYIDDTHLPDDYNGVLAWFDVMHSNNSVTIAVTTNNDATEAVTFKAICNDTWGCSLDDCFGVTSSVLVVIEDSYSDYSNIYLYFIDRREKTKSFYVNVTSGDVKFSLPSYKVNSKTI